MLTQWMLVCWKPSWVMSDHRGYPAGEDVRAVRVIFFFFFFCCRDSGGGNDRAAGLMRTEGVIDGALR